MYKRGRGGGTYGLPACLLVGAVFWVPAGVPDEGAWAERGEGDGAGVYVLGRVSECTRQEWRGGRYPGRAREGWSGVVCGYGCRGWWTSDDRRMGVERGDGIGDWRGGFL